MEKMRRTTIHTFIVVLFIALALLLTILRHINSNIIHISFFVLFFAAVGITFYLFISETTLVIERDRLVLTHGLIQTNVIPYDRILNCERFFHFPGARSPIIDPIDNIEFNKGIIRGMSWLAVHLVNGDTRYIPVKDPIESLNILVKAIEAYKQHDHGL